MRPGAVLVALAGLACLAGAAAPQKAGPPKKAAPAKKTEPQDRFLSGRPFKLEDLKTALPVPEPRLLRSMQSRGLDFEYDQATLDELKSAGASDAVLETVRKLARPLPPKVVEPPRPVTGALAITCAPAECEVSVNGAAKGETKGGKLDVAGLPVGKVIVDFAKRGHLGVQVAVTVEADRATAATARLEPDRATQEAFGAQLFARVVAALGGDTGLKEASSLAAAGAADLWGKDGKRRSWTHQTRFSLPDKALFRLTGGGIQYEFAFLAARYTSNNKLRGDEAQEIETLFRQYRDDQLPNLIDRIRKAQARFSAPRVEATSGEDYFLLVDIGSEKYTIGLDRESRPQTVKIDSPTGLGSGTTLLFSNYAKSGNAVFPKVFQLRLPDAEQHGLEVRCETVELNRTFKDSDFQIKRGLFR